MKQVTLNVEGMSCNHCLNAVEGAVKSVGATGKVDLSLKKVDIEFDENKVSLDHIKKAIVDQGYDVV
ncbi:copper ion binding protein [Paenibacillus crassostreae]|uniref:Copper resistance protein CopZ n=1 Tax=Paenibacillus crassostreae TaxID=1763538 RepID=A0A167BUF5_9BACL|nr:copper ion binding protein [Paenibacillus crassostreae]AOZ92507.1 copper resistance protein CopZ [Paenibacillus crassostreae]OAB72456.1 copper resistance protein CopZ [Paenibacillus crassostreae]